MMLKYGMRLIRFEAASSKPNVEVESNLIIQPHFYQRTDVLSKIQHYFINRSTLNDIERSFRNFKRANIPKEFLYVYNDFVHNLKKEKYQKYDEYLAPTLAEEFKKKSRNKEELPFYFQEASECQLVQARSYSQNLPNMKSLNKWYQLTVRYRSGGEEDYHVLERNDKLKHFRFIKFYL